MSKERFVDVLKTDQYVIKDMETGELFIAEDLAELLNNGLCQCHNRLIQKENTISDATDIVVINDNGYYTNHYINKEE